MSDLNERIEQDSASKEEATKKASQKKRIILILIIAAIVVGCAVLIWFTGAGEKIKQALAYDEETILEDPTCTEPGLVVKKNDLGFKKKEEIPAIGHSFITVDMMIEPSCTSDGVALCACSICGYQESKAVEALGHNYESVREVEPTCTMAGMMCDKCSRCGERINIETLPALGHNWVDATCTEPKRCTLCGDTEGDPLGHNYVDDICTVCGAEKASEGLKIENDVVVGIGSCKDTDLIIPKNVTAIGRAAFSNCSGLTSVTIPESITEIGDMAFQFCSGLTSVTIPNGVTKIGYYAFRECSNLRSVEIPSSVTSIGSYAFYKCNSLTSIIIPDGVETIGQTAFSGCKSLTSVTLPNSISLIDMFAFSNCKSLKNIIFEGSEEEWKAVRKASFWADGSNFTVTFTK